MSNRHKQKAPHLHPGAAPTYYECPVCGLLSSDPEFATGSLPCPLCGTTGGNRRTFPTDRLRRLDERIRRYHDDAEYEIVVILVTAFLEAILEDILDRILSARGADLAMRKLLLDSQRSIGQRIGRLFPKLTGDEFEEAAEKLGYREFPLRWRGMRGARNAFIHDSPFHGPRETIDRAMGEEAMTLLSQAYEVFVLLNNEYVADHRDHRK